MKLSNKKPKKKITQLQYEFLTLSLIVGVILFFFALNPDGFIKALNPQPQLDIPQGENQDAVDLKQLVSKSNTFKAVPIQTKQKVSPGGSYLIIGDSMMQWGIGSEIENSILASDASYVYRQGIQSTGLLHPERLDWYKEVDRLMSQQSYDVVIIMFGLNDADHVLDEKGEYHLYGTEQWKIAYAKKVDDILYKLLVEHKVKKVLWIEQPKMSTNQWDSVATTFNEIYKTVLDRYINALFVDIYDRFSVDGMYSAVITDDNGISQTARQADGIHMNLFGGKIIAETVFKVMQSNDISISKR